MECVGTYALYAIVFTAKNYNILNKYHLWKFVKVSECYPVINLRISSYIFEVYFWSDINNNIIYVYFLKLYLNT